MSFPAYLDYQDSGVPWLGDIPAGWSVGRIKDLFEIRKRIAGELGHDVLSITQSGLRVKDVEGNEGQQAMDYSKYQKVLPGEFAMNHMDLLTGWIDIATQAGVTSPDYRVFGARNPDAVDADYFLRVFQMAYSARQFYPFGQGSSQLGRWRLPKDEFYAFPVPIPSLDEQKQIRLFLDRETAKIDALVAEQERLIALLKEKRQAIISHAVTKGLDRDAPMKDSGTEWLGEIPAHWDVMQLRRVLELQRGHDLPAEARKPGPFPVVSSGGVIDTHDEAITSGPCIVTGRYGSIGKFNLIEEPCWPLNTALYTTRLDGLARFQLYMLHNLTPLFEAFAAKSAVPGVDRNDLHPLLVCQPPLDEQEQIVEYLEQQFMRHQAVADEAVALITLMKERRAALISAAVTGKIDVRGHVEQHEMEAA